MLNLTFLGTFEAKIGDVSLKFATDKIRALLAYLAIEVERPHRRETLGTLLWENQTDSQARTNLRLSLHRLRQTLGGDAQEILTVTRTTVQLNLTGVTVDVHRFGEAIKQSERHAHADGERCLDCEAALLVAAGLYGGDLLPAFNIPEAEAFAEWLQVKRAYFHQQALGVFGRLATIFAGQSRHDQSLLFAQRQLALEPWLESAHRQAMVALALQGERNLALGQYEKCRQILADELGVDPTVETTQLYQQIKANELANSYQQAGLHHFPAQKRAFVGRESELEGVLEQLAHPDCRLLTLLGVGGSGKTTLAIQAARQLEVNGLVTGNDIYFVPLAGVADAEQVAYAIADKLGIPVVKQMDMQTQLLTYLQSRQYLLVIDNFEHLMPAKPLLEALLSHAPKLKLLVTSREPLNLSAEWRMGVGGLLLSGAEQLFGQVAQQTDARFQINAGNRAHIIRLCELVNGLPLAVEIAASWVRMMDVTAIVAQVEKSLNFLVATMGDLPTRHQSLQAVFDYSWQLLSPSLQRVLVQATIFRGTFSLAAFLQILPDVSLLRLMELLDKSLVGRGIGGRYQIHPLLGQFAEGKYKALAQQERGQTTNDAMFSQIQIEFVNYYLSQLIEHGKNETLLDLKPDLDNIRQAWRWGIEFDQNALLTDAVTHLSRLYHALGFLAEGEQRIQAGLAKVASTATAWEQCQWLLELTQFVGGQSKFTLVLTYSTQAIDLAIQANAPYLQVQGLYWRGYWLRHMGQLMEGGESLHTALTLLPRDKDAELRTRIELEQGMIWLLQGKTTQALPAFETALAYFKQVKDLQGIATCLGYIAGVYRVKGEVTLAIDYYQQAITQARAIQFDHALSRCLVGLAHVYLWQTAYEDVLACVAEAMALAEASGDLRVVVDCLTVRGNLQVSQGLLREAKVHFEQGLRLAENAGMLGIVGWMLGKLGVVSAQQEELAVAVDYYERAIAISREVADQQNLAVNLINLASAYNRMEKYEAAHVLLKQAYPLVQKMGALKVVTSTLLVLGVTLKHLGKYDQAFVYHEEATLICRELGNRQNEAKHLGCMGLLQMDMGNFALAIEFITQANQLSEEINDSLSNGVWLQALGKGYRLIVDHEKAGDYLQRSEKIFRQKQSKTYLAVTLLAKATLYFEQGRYESAKLAVEEVFTLLAGGDVNSHWMEAQILSARLLAVAGQKREAMGLLRTQLPAASGQWLADMYFYLWLFGGDEGDRVAAVRGYEKMPAFQNLWLAQERLRVLKEGV